ncbi:hypothetical protein WJX81_006567 [Elliptochloris bilobata]|uniref:Thiol-disulfide oxidoreductase DCC n=1 Tax=Elliptochloris bilobata TaxID=381761 RepID=A0AAW1RLK2_9CHLO
MAAQGAGRAAQASMHLLRTHARQSPCQQALGRVRFIAVRVTEGKTTEHAPAAGLGGGWDITMLHDGACPLCEREVNMLRRRDAGVGKIRFVDINEPGYRPEDNAGISYEQAMGNIHGILPEGRVVTGVEVFRRLYDAVGLGWVYAITRLPLVGRLADAVYAFWARVRLPLTGRDFQTVLQEKKTCKQT